MSLRAVFGEFVCYTGKEPKENDDEIKKLLS